MPGIQGISGMWQAGSKASGNLHPSLWTPPLLPGAAPTQGLRLRDSSHCQPLSSTQRRGEGLGLEAGGGQKGGRVRGEESRGVLGRGQCLQRHRCPQPHEIHCSPPPHDWTSGGHEPTQTCKDLHLKWTTQHHPHRREGQGTGQGPLTQRHRTSIKRQMTHTSEGLPCSGAREEEKGLWRGNESCRHTHTHAHTSTYTSHASSSWGSARRPHPRSGQPAQQPAS